MERYVTRYTVPTEPGLFYVDEWDQGDTAGFVIANHEITIFKGDRARERRDVFYDERVAVLQGVD